MYMLRNESRNLLMQAFEKNHNVIQMLPVLEWVYGWSIVCASIWNKLGAWTTEQEADPINTLMQKQPDITIREIKEKIHLNMCEETIRKAVIKPGYRVKKSSHDSEQEHRCSICRHIALILTP